MNDHYISAIDALNLVDETVGHPAGWQAHECFHTYRPGDRAVHSDRDRSAAT